MRKFLGGLGIALLLSVAIIPVAFAEPLSTSTLGTSIDTMNGTIYDYFIVLLNKYWPLVVGFGVLVLVWGFGRRIVQHFS